MRANTSNAPVYADYRAALEAALTLSTKLDKPIGIFASRYMGPKGFVLEEYKGWHKHKRGVAGTGKGRPAGLAFHTQVKEVRCLVYPAYWFGGFWFENGDMRSRIWIRNVYNHTGNLRRIFNPMPFQSVDASVTELERDWPLSKPLM